MTDLKTLAALQEKATKGDLSTAELVEGEDGCFDCPYCEGDGYVHGRQYINFDGAALNVMFSGIGDEHVNWQNFFNAITKTDFAALADEMERMRKALEDIAAFNDDSGNRFLEECGSYSGFDEPGSVQIAREALEKPE